MDFERFEKLFAKHSKEIAAHRGAVQRATASVECAEAMIKLLKAERMKLGDLISAEVAQERRRIDSSLGEWTRKLKERKEVLSALQGVDQGTLDNIVNRMKI